MAVPVNNCHPELAQHNEGFPKPQATPSSQEPHEPPTPKSSIAPRLIARVLVTAHLLSLVVSCTTVDNRHQVIVSVPDQRMALLQDGAPFATYPVSTSKFGLGDLPGTSWTPLGKLEIVQKIGDGAPSGAAFKDRRPTGEVIPPDAPGRDIIVSRILWLKGDDAQNANAYGRYIYIHGTPEERNIGQPVSYGCIRMRSRDVIELFDLVGPGAQVKIENAPLETLVPGLGPVGEGVAAVRTFDRTKIR